MLRLMIGTRTIATRLEFLGKQPGETVIVRIVRIGNRPRNHHKFGAVFQQRIRTAP